MSKKFNPLDMVVGPSRLGPIGTPVGRTMAEMAGATASRQEQQALAITEKLMQEDFVQSLIGATDDRNAVIQSLLSTLNDPDAGFADEHLLDHKEKLLRISESAMDEDQAKEVLKKLVDTVVTSSQSGRERFSAHLDQFRGLGPQLTAPAPFKPNTAFNPIASHDLSPFAKQSLSQLEAIMGPGTAQMSDFVSLTTGGQTAQYIRVFADKGHTRHQRTIPLDLFASGSAKRGVDVPIIATGQNLNTLSTANIRFTTAGSAKAGKLPGSGESIERFFINQLRGFVGQNRFGFKDAQARSDFLSLMTETTQSASRLMGLTGASAAAMEARFPGMQAHLMSAAKMRHSYATIAGMERLPASQREAFVKSLVGAESAGGFAGGVSASRILSNELVGGQYATLSLAGANAFSALKVGVSNRNLLPGVARIEQVVGREGMWLADANPSSMGRGGAFRAGAGGAPIEWSGALTGATNKAILMDVTSGLGKGQTRKLSNLAGSGQAYGFGNVGRIQETFSVPVLDASSRKQLSSTFIEKLRANPGQFVDVDDMSSLMGEGLYLGEGPQGARFLTADPRTRSLSAMLVSSQDQGGKLTHHVEFVRQRDMDTAKIFSLLHKGTVVDADRNQMLKLLADEYGVTSDMLKNLNIPEKHLLVGTGDMLKKGSEFFNLQMISGMGMVTGRSDAFEIIAKQAGTQKYSVLGDTKVGRVTGAVIDQLVKSGASAKEAGMVLAAVHTAKTSPLEQKNVEAAINTAFGPKMGSAVIQQARRGMALGATSASIGAGVGDYGFGRGSLESRSLSMLQSRMMDMGMDNATISQFMSGVMANKVGGTQQLKAAQGLALSMESVLGMRRPGTDTSKATRIGLDELVQRFGAAPAHGEGSFVDFLKTQQNGVVLDLKSGSLSKTTAGQTVLHNAQAAFGGSSEIYLPGSATLDAMSGTVIKKGEETLQIGSRFEKSVGKLVNDVANMSTNAALAADKAGMAFQRFRDTTADDFAQTFHRLSAGKMKGSQMMPSHAYDMKTGVGMTPHQHQLAKQLAAKSPTQAVFMDAIGFTGVVSDMKSPLEEKAGKLEQFFTGLHREGAEARGAQFVTARTPTLSRGNIAFTEVFQDVREFERDGGTMWKSMRKAGVLDRALGAFRSAGGQGQVMGFRDIAMSNHADARKAFFHEMAANLGDFVTRGGGRVFMPDHQITIGLGGTDLAGSVDLGVAGAAFGDHDGDHWMMMILNDKTGKQITSTLGKGSNSEAYRAREMHYKASKEIYGEAMKEGLKKQQKAMGVAVDLGDEDAAARAAGEDLMKEMYSKRSIGQLDNKLNSVRAAVLENAEANPQAANEALAFLSTLSEHAVLKGKKLPIARDLGKFVGDAVDQMWKTGKGDMLEQVLEREIFAGVDSFNLLMGGEQNLTSTDPALKDATMSLRRTLDFVYSSVDVARSRGAEKISSPGRIAAALKGAKGGDIAARATMDLINNPTLGGLSAGLMGGFGAETLGTEAAGRRLYSEAAGVVQGLADRVGGMDRRFMGKAAIGLATAGVVGSALFGGREGVLDPPPMAGSMGAAQTGFGLTSAVATGSLFGGSDNIGPNPDDLAPPADPYFVGDSPINIGTTYAAKPNSYQIQGTVPNAIGVSGSVDYLNRLGNGTMRGSVNVNDRRRPITANYLDRLNGDY